MVIEYPIPNGTMRINVEEFFLHGTKTKIKKVLDQYKESGADKDEFWRLLELVCKKKGLTRGDRLLLFVKRDENAEKLSRCTELYQKMRDPVYPEYTKDKKIRLQAKNEMNSAKSDLKEVMRGISENEKQEKKWDLCRELIEAVIDSL